MLDGDRVPFLKRGRSPPFQYSAHCYRGQTAECIKMPLGMDVGLSPGNFVLDGDPVPVPKKGAEPRIFGPSLLWPNGWMHQDATSYGGRSQPRRLCVRWGPSPLPQKGRSPPILGPRLLWPNGCMDQDGTWYGGRPRPTRHCVQCGPSYPQKKGTPTPLNFWPMSIVARRLEG